MGSGVDGCFGCLPWRRRRVSSAGDIGTAVRPAPGTAGNVRGILKKSPEPPPPKWRSQVGASDSSSTASINGGTSDSVLANYNVTASACGPAEDVPTVSPKARSRSSLVPTQIRFASQPIIHPIPTSSAPASVNSVTSNYQSPRSGGPGSPVPTEGAFGDPDAPVGGSSGSGAAAATGLAPVGAAAVATSTPPPPGPTPGWSESTSRLQDLQERFRQRAARGSSGAATTAGGLHAVAGTPIDDRLRGSDQMQCDSFSYSASVHGRRASNGGRLGPLPPLSPSPGRTSAYGHGQMHLGGEGAGGAELQARKLDQGAQPKQQKASLSTDLYRLHSITAHIPGSLPSMTQPQPSPAAVRIYPPPAPWENTPPPTSTAQPTQPPPTAPQPPRVSWSDVEIASGQKTATGPAAAEATTAAASNPLALKRSAQSIKMGSEQQKGAASTGSDGDDSDEEGPDLTSCEVQGFSFSSHWSRAPSRHGGGSGSDGVAVGVSNRVAAPSLQQMNKDYSRDGPPPPPHGATAHRAASASAVIGTTTTPASDTAPLGRQLGGVSVNGAEQISAAEQDDPTRAGAVRHRLSRPGKETGVCATADVKDASLSAPLFDRLTPGGGGGGGGGGGRTFAKQESFAAVLEQHTAPGNFPSAVQPRSPLEGPLQVIDSVAAEIAAPGRAPSSLPPPPPIAAMLSQHRFSLRLMPEQLLQPQQDVSSQSGDPAAAAAAAGAASVAAGRPPPPAQPLPSPAPPPPQHRFSLRLMPEQSLTQNREDAQREGAQLTENPVKKMAFGEGPQSPATDGSSSLPLTGAAGSSKPGNEPGREARPAVRAAQQRMQAARANEEMLQALLGSSKRALDIPTPQSGTRGGAAAELERFDRVQDAMSRLEGILAAPAPAPVAVPGRSLNARAGTSEDAAYDFAGAAPAIKNSDFGVKPW